MRNYFGFVDKLWVRILLSSFFLMWIILFTTAPKIPLSIRPEIDVYSLHFMDYVFLHYLPSTYLAELQCDFLDILGAIAYTIHTAWPFVFLAYMIFYGRRDLILPYLNCFGALCFLSVVTQLIMPTAPPWYFYKYGYAPANYNMTGDPAGLIRVDHMFNITFYQNMFDASPLVFGSFPSLHVGWPSVLALLVFYDTTLPRGIKWASVAYVAYVALAVMYLQHHYFVDAFGGVFYSVAIYKVIGPKRPPPPHKTPSLQTLRSCCNI